MPKKDSRINTPNYFTRSAEGENSSLDSLGTVSPPSPPRIDPAPPVDPGGDPLARAWEWFSPAEMAHASQALRVLMRLGGPRPLLFCARAFGSPWTRAKMRRWLRHGVVPPEYWTELLRDARRLGILLTDDDLRFHDGPSPRLRRRMTPRKRRTRSPT